MIISDKIIEDQISTESVIYRPPSLVIGVGLHWDTSKETILEGIESCLEKFKLSSKSIAKLVSIKKPKDVQGLIDAGKEINVPVQYIEREELAEITAPNPSETVKAFEGTASVSEARCHSSVKRKINRRKAEIPSKFDYSHSEGIKLKRGLLLIDRGSREREASEELETICDGIKAKGDYVFTDYCFLEVEPPYIEDGITKCLKEDIDSLTIVPYFLYPGKK